MYWKAIVEDTRREAFSILDDLSFGYDLSVTHRICGLQMCMRHMTGVTDISSPCLSPRQTTTARMEPRHEPMRMHTRTEEAEIL